jgi:hypothetical protein
MPDTYADDDRRYRIGGVIQKTHAIAGVAAGVHARVR